MADFPGESQTQSWPLTMHVQLYSTCMCDVREKARFSHNNIAWLASLCHAIKASNSSPGPGRWVCARLAHLKPNRNLSTDPATQDSEILYSGSYLLLIDVAKKDNIKESGKGIAKVKSTISQLCKLYKYSFGSLLISYPAHLGPFGFFFISFL